MAGEGDRFFQVAYGLIREDQKLAKCSEVSLAISMYTCAKLGLIPDPVMGHAHIVPFKGQATVIVGFKGYIELASRHPDFLGFYCPPQIVYRNDEFDFQLGTSPKIVHRNWRQVGAPDAGPPIASYLVANICRSKQPELMWSDEIEAIKKNVHAVRQGRQTPWTGEHHEVMEMWKKTVIRRAQKRWPQRAELALADQVDHAYDQGEHVSSVVTVPEVETLPEGEGSLSHEPITESDIDAALGSGTDDQRGD